MTYSELKTAVLALAHRPDLTNEVATFIQLAEGMIARDLRSLEQVTIITITDDDRDSEGKYTLPSDFLEIRTLYGADPAGGEYELDQVSLSELKTYRPVAPPLVYAIRGKSTIEIAGTPSSGASFELEYFARPAALSSDSDTNALLTNHPVVYIEAALFHLHKFTQDPEQAQGALDTYTNAVDTLNEQARHVDGGARIQSAYNLGNFGPRSGY